jgi:hypothetical protein
MAVGPSGFSIEEADMRVDSFKKWKQARPGIPVRLGTSTPYSILLRHIPVFVPVRVADVIRRHSGSRTGVSFRDAKRKQRTLELREES